MKHARFMIGGLLFALLSLLWAAPASALVILVKPSPTPAHVTFGGAAATFTVNWTITRTLAGGPVDLISPPGRLRVGGVVVANTPSRRKIYSGNPGTIVFTETATVPASVMRRALADSSGVIVYERDFADDPPALTVQTGALNVVVTGGGMGGPVSLSEVTLDFDNGATFATIPQDGALRAVAHIHASGAGLLNGVWETNDGTADGFYRPLRAVSVTLSGQRVFTETSPPLPTREQGRHNVRFRVISPAGSEIHPVISWFVTSAAAALKPSLPADGARLERGTKFTWSAAKGASAYRVQILDGAGNPVAAQLVRVNEATLSAFVFAQLQGPATYRWRVSALDSQGSIIATSDPRAIRVHGR